MTSSSKGSHRIPIDQICIGLHIKLDSWMGHPFLLSNFKIKTEKQISELKSMGLTDIAYLPEKSDREPAAPAPEQDPTPATDSNPETLAAQMRQKRAHIKNLSLERERIRNAERKYTKTADSVKNVMRLANNSPQKAAQLSGEIADELAELFSSEQNPYIHLMGDHVTDENAYFHGLNVTVLSLILA
ncbi:MAG: DUF3391 domain-containing protein, partial [Sulfuritalea sp.]|nr:DUF3391 domain-containing protein [Sulfuritalea sp.]